MRGQGRVGKRRNDRAREALKIQVWRSEISALGGPGEKGFTRRGSGAKKEEWGRRSGRRKRPRKKGERLEEDPGHLP